MKAIFFVVFVQALTHQAIAKPLKIAIDPGHGGAETGAVHGLLREADLALSIAQKLKARLDRDKAFQGFLVRSKDQDLSLEDRVQLSKKLGSDLFVSIHANAHSSPKASGAEFYIESQMPMEEETRFLAHNELTHSKGTVVAPEGDVESILYDLKKSHRILKSYQVSAYLRKNWAVNGKSRVIRQGPFFVLNQNDIPAVLVEVGYLSNPSDRKKLSDPNYQNEIAKNIHEGLTDYAKNMDKLP